jgi:hypothetical protein
MDRFCTIKRVMVAQRSDQRRRYRKKDERILYIQKKMLFNTAVEPSHSHSTQPYFYCLQQNVLETDSLPLDASIRIETVASGGKILKFG